MKSEHGAEYRPDIDGLRAVAVLAVLWYHAFPNVMRGGYVGVDVFFVISGFLITSIIVKDLRRGRFSFLEFYGRRGRRIFPALALVLLATVLAGWVWLVPEAYAQLGKHVAGGAAFVSNLILWSESGYFDVGADKKILLHLWSLGIEEQFYIIWPVLLAIGAKRRWNLKKLTLGLLFASFIYGLVVTGRRPTWAFYSPFSRFWELSLGSWLAMLHLATPERLNFGVPKALRSVLSGLGLLLIVIAALAFKNGTPFPGWRALLPTLGAVLMIAAGPDAWLNRQFLARPWMVAIGLISYPLYLWHWVLLSMLRQLVEIPSPALVWGAVGASFLLSWLTFKFLEKPVRFALARTRVAQGLCMAMGLLLILGCVIKYRDGLPGRLPPEVRGWASVTREDFQWETHARSGGCHVYDPALVENGEECVETARPRVMLWGDSYAAALYPGLKALQAERPFGLSQMTSAACPPLLDIQYSGHRDNCAEINRRLVVRLKTLDPDIILLQTTWDPVDYRLSSEIYFGLLRRTVQAIHAEVPRARVKIVGPVPRWVGPLQECYARHYMRYRKLPPEHTSYCLNSESRRLDITMAELARELSVEYVSLQRQFCNDEGCLTRVGSDPLDLQSIDGGHLSPAAAKWVIKAAANDLLQP